jgi:hypothetical protein
MEIALDYRRRPARPSGAQKRFHFNRRAGPCTALDLDGTALPSPADALTHAYLLIWAMSRDEPRRSRSHLLEVRDDAGTLLFEVPFSAAVRVDGGA